MSSHFIVSPGSDISSTNKPKYFFLGSLDIAKETFLKNTLKVHLTPNFFSIKKSSCHGDHFFHFFFFLLFGQILDFFCPVEVEFWMDHDRVKRDLGRVLSWHHFEKTIKPSQPIPWISCGSSRGFLARKFILFGVYSFWNSNEIYIVFRIVGVGEELWFRRLGNEFYRCLNDRQPVKVLKSLNDQQSDIFLKF